MGQRTFRWTGRMYGGRRVFCDICFPSRHPPPFLKTNGAARDHDSKIASYRRRRFIVIIVNTRTSTPYQRVLNGKKDRKNKRRRRRASQTIGHDFFVFRFSGLGFERVPPDFSSLFVCFNFLLVTPVQNKDTYIVFVFVAFRFQVSHITHLRWTVLSKNTFRPKISAAIRVYRNVASDEFADSAYERHLN